MPTCVIFYPAAQVAPHDSVNSSLNVDVYRLAFVFAIDSVSGDEKRSPSLQPCVPVMEVGSTTVACQCRCSAANGSVADA